MKDFPYLVLMCLLLLMPGRGSEAACAALKIWGLELVPSLFPYMVLCQTLTQSFNRKKRKPSFLPFFLGLLGGSPSASAALSAIAESQPLGKKTLLFLTSLAGTISPMFFLSVTSSWFDSLNTSYRLMLSQYFAALLTGLLFYSFSENDSLFDKNANCTQASAQHDDPIAKSVHAVLSVGGCIVFFSTTAAYIPSSLSSLHCGLPQTLHAILEISGGLHALSGAELDSRMLVITASGLCSFGGISILNQNHLFLRNVGLKKGELLFISLTRGFFGMLIMMLFTFIP